MYLCAVYVAIFRVKEAHLERRRGLEIFAPSPPAVGRQAVKEWFQVDVLCDLWLKHLA